MQWRASACPSCNAKAATRTHAAIDGSYALHEWALQRDDDMNDIELVKEVNPASWQTVDALRERRDSPSTLQSQWARFACGVWMVAEEWWITGEDWHNGETLEGLRPGDRVALGFDGSRFGDATALAACRLKDGLVQLLDVWQAPEGAPDDWEVPAGKVDVAVAQAMETYKVVRGYFDPPLWQTEIDDWAQRYGEQAVMRFYTNRARMFGAVRHPAPTSIGNVVPHVYDER
jgi:hypothetical protein